MIYMIPRIICLCEQIHDVKKVNKKISAGNF
jgi:hypothetical protein